LDDRLQILQELLSCLGKVYGWCYDAEGNLLGTNCPDRVLDNFFSSTGCLDAVLRHGAESRFPILLSIPYGLSWSAVFEQEDGKLKRIHVFGPTINTGFSNEGISKAVQSAKITSHWRPKLIKLLQNIPVISTVNLSRYTLMLHYSVTGEQLTITDIVFHEPAMKKTGNDLTPKKDRMNTYRIERALLNMVTEGDLGYKSILNDAISASRGVQAGGIGTLEQARVTQIVFISLCTRAAIQGGLSPEIAYSRGDAYIQNILDCKTMAEAVNIGHTMYDDFINLVHKCRSNPNYSPYIQACCDYIELHAEDKISLSEIAGRIGYADYYLSRKFKAETGCSINDYIKIVKVNHAKALLLSSNLSIQEICDRLNFGSRSFFSETFKEIAGIPPAAFKEQNSRT
jgi:AraC-like DNA-binding protein